MPSEEAQSAYGYPRRGHGHSYITAKEIVGIGVLTVILGLVLFLGCWYCRRRNGYGSLKGKSRYVGIQHAFTGGCPREGLGHQDSKLPFLENNYEPVVPNAPPAYEKLSTQQSPPPYSP
ncbi:melanoma antigen recognized by T-cells 1 [Pipistrellus kuhlii]|uniref:Melan-A n=1 Tax=Pipistrellus kuhlii TaxID=59472 RepID=A0A7J7W3C3_PIPKU|nr:melanoma antigen recognized by T-cells 1 [Pipistrellus kuhlii]XP_036289902.1 melanoma antigen recognized by T-cells 1 [Pipistrellus kuhlii]KAF6331929.1 melan-A [Pipistrellus kuhlii]